MASLAATITAAPSCAACLFGATATVKYSYTVHAIRTVNVTLIPHVMTFSTAQNITSWETIKQTDTIYVGDDNDGVTDSANATTFNSPADITWTVGNATLTYPTTYIRYLGFAGDAPPDAPCAEDTNAEGIRLPQSTAIESMIYPYDCSDSTLPAALLDYLGSFATVTEQLNHASPAACEPLTITPRPSIITISVSRSTKKYEGPLTHLTRPPLTIETSTNHNSTRGPWGSHSTGGTVMTSNSSIQPIAPTSFASSSAEVTNTNPKQGPGLSTVPLISGPANDHTTAFVLNTITGREIVVAGDPTAESVVTETEPNASPTGDTIQRPTSAGNDGQASPQPTQSVGQDEGPQSPVQPSQDVGNILDLLPSLTAAQPPDGVQSPAPSDDARPAVTQPSIFIVGTTTLSADLDGNFDFGSQVLTPGQTIDVGSETSATPAFVEVEHGTTRLVVGDSTFDPVAESSPTASDGSVVVVDGTTLVVPDVTAPPGSLITIGGQPFSALQSDGSVVLVHGTSTIKMGAGFQTILNQQTFRVDKGGSILVVDGSTVPVAYAATPTPTQTIISANGNTLTAIDEVGSVILQDGVSTTAVRDGAQTSFEGQAISVLDDGSGVVVDGTITAHFGSTATSTGVGDYINSGVIPSPTSSGDDTVESQTSENGAGRIPLWTSASILGSAVFISILL